MQTFRCLLFVFHIFVSSVSSFSSFVRVVLGFILITSHGRLIHVKPGLNAIKEDGLRNVMWSLLPPMSRLVGCHEGTTSHLDDKRVFPT